LEAFEKGIQVSLSNFCFRIGFKDGEPRNNCFVAIWDKHIHGCPIVPPLEYSEDRPRKIVLIREDYLPQKLLRYYKPNIDSIRNRLYEYMEKQNLGAVSAHKSLAADIAEEIVTDLPQARLCGYKFGPVVACFLSNDTKNEFEICVYPLLKNHEIDQDREKGLQARLRLYKRYDPDEWLLQYIEDAIFFLEKIYRSSPHDVAIRYCRKIRETLGESFDSKIDDIKRGLASKVPEMKRIAEDINMSYQTKLSELGFCRELILLLVNYIYSFLKFTSRVEHYQKKIDLIIGKIEKEKNGQISEQIRLLISAYKKLVQNERVNLIPEKGCCDDWVRLLIWTIKKTQAVKEVLSSQRIDTSKVNLFLSHHMSAVNSLLFASRLKQFLQDEKLDYANIVIGSTEEWIHDAVDALIWISDGLCAYIPSVCNDFQGQEILHHEWIIREILHAKMLDKPVFYVFEFPSHFNMELFKKQLKDFEREYGEIDAEGINLNDSYKNKLVRCIREIPTDMQMKFRVEYTPTYKFDEKISKAFKHELTKISVSKCFTIIKMIRLSFSRKAWYPILHLHRLSRYKNKFICRKDIVNNLLEDRLFPYERKTPKKVQEFLRSCIVKYKEIRVHVGEEYHPIIEVDDQGNLRSAMFDLMIAMQGAYKITTPLISDFDSHIERDDLIT
jgi:hypothetical protein